MNNNQTIQDIINEFNKKGLCEAESTQEPVLTMDIQLPSGEIINGASIFSVHEKYFDGRPPRRYFMFEQENTDCLGIEEIELGEYLRVKQKEPGRWVTIGI